MTLNKELEGLLVVSVEQAVAAPYCGLLLADAGARVIKVERPDGDFARSYDTSANGQSSIFAWLNRGKESICLNLKDSSDMAVMRRMLAKADVFVSNLATGAVARMGLDGASLRVNNAGLTCVTITGYGEAGDSAEKKAYDFLVQGESGICSVTGTKDAPARVGVSLSDLSTGLTAFSAILRSLIQRGRTGQGSDLSIAMFDVMADWMNMPLLAHRYMGQAPERTGLQHSFIAPYGAFVCKSGQQVLLSIQNNREWAEFCKQVLLRPDFIADIRFLDNPDRYANRVALDALVNEVFAQYDVEEVIAKLEKARIANGALSSVGDLSNHRFLKNTSASFGEAEISLAALPVRGAEDGPTQVPALGEHSQAVRTEFQ